MDGIRSQNILDKQFLFDWVNENRFLRISTSDSEHLTFMKGKNLDG